MPDPQLSAVRIAGLVLVNAMVFQEELAGVEGRVSPLGRVATSRDLRAGFVQAWEEILDINYVPIFRVAREVLIALPSSADLDTALRQMSLRAGEIVAKRGALRHDLMGRVFHRLLHEAKYLGTYYTSVPAATLLAKVALDPHKWPSVSWADLESIGDFRIVDMACGTGTLLMASVQAATDNYVRTRAGAAESVDLPAFHQTMVESTLWGFDVLTSAIHLTASTLALLSPAVSFNHMNLQVLPLGGSNRSLGSVDFLLGETIPVQQNLFESAGEATQVTGLGEEHAVAEIPQIDLSIMNPPFTRSVGGSLLFGSRPEGERRQMQARLREMLASGAIQANSTAGLAPVFVAVADVFLKVGGRQALVSPRALVSGVAWAETRGLLTSRYVVEHVISSHEPEHWNFSENTSLSEVLVVAQRVDQRPEAPRTVWVNLWRNPQTMVEATALSEAIRTAEVPRLEGVGVMRLEPDGRQWGEIFSTPTDQLDRELWIYHAFAQTELVRVAAALLHHGRVEVPGGGATTVDLRPLGELGTLGPDRRDIHDGFTVGSAVTPYPTRWGHRGSTSRTLQLPADRYLIPRAAGAAGRPLRGAALLWSRAGQLLIAERLRLNTHRLAAAWAPVPVLSNVWWPFRIQGADADLVGKALALWLNSSLGLLSLIARREETEGAWIALKKPVLQDTPVLNVSALPRTSMVSLGQEFDRVASLSMPLIGELGQGGLRHEIDQALERILDLPPLDGVREMLGREPIVALEPLE